MGKFKTWLEDAAPPKSGAVSNSSGDPANPTQSAQAATQIANTAIADKSNATDIKKITAGDTEGRVSGVRNDITGMAQRALQKAPLAPTTFKNVATQISAGLPIKPPPTYFQPMKTFMAKENKHFVTSPTTDLLKDKPQSPHRSLPKRGTTISHARGAEKKAALISPINFAKPANLS